MLDQVAALLEGLLALLHKPLYYGVNANRHTQHTAAVVTLDLLLQLSLHDKQTCYQIQW